MNTKKTIAIGSDHAGYAYKIKIAEHLRGAGYEVIDVGCENENSCHYPIFAHKLSTLIQSGECSYGILVCGTGIGMSIAANKHAGIRAAVCSDEYCTEMTRSHNDSNVLCLGARVIDLQKAIALTEIFLKTELADGNHALRIAMISDFEKGNFPD